MGISKCNLIPDKSMVYLGIECDSLLQTFVARQWVSFSDLEKLIEKLVSLECAVPAGMWYVKEKYSAMRKSGVTPDSRKNAKNGVFIQISVILREARDA